MQRPRLNFNSLTTGRRFVAELERCYGGGRKNGFLVRKHGSKDQCQSWREQGMGMSNDGVSVECSSSTRSVWIGAKELSSGVSGWANISGVGY